LLLASGVALMSAERFVLFGEGFPRLAADLLGGTANLLRLHAVWGLVWAVLVVPVFLLLKRGGLEALEEVRLSRDDLRWLWVKPRALLGLTAEHLPPQDKYNAGQKAFALTVLAGTGVIIATGLVMTFHLGSARLVAASIALHKLAILALLLGLALHVTMAAVIREERPALWSMLTGRITRRHAEHHSSKWVQELDAGDDGRRDGSD